MKQIFSFFLILLIIVVAGFAGERAFAARVEPQARFQSMYPSGLLPDSIRAAAITDASTTENILKAATRSLFGDFQSNTTNTAKTATSSAKTSVKKPISVPNPIAPKQKRKAMATTSIKVGARSIIAEVATSTADQELGLGMRDSLPGDRGMLFIFQVPGIYGFWMKDMHFPIDIVWVDSSKKVLNVSANATPASYPVTFEPVSPAKYVLEINAGSAKAYGLATGTILKF